MSYIQSHMNAWQQSCQTVCLSGFALQHEHQNAYQTSYLEGWQQASFGVRKTQESQCHPKESFPTYPLWARPSQAAKSPLKLVHSEDQRCKDVNSLIFFYGPIVKDTTCSIKKVIAWDFSSLKIYLSLLFFFLMSCSTETQTIRNIFFIYFLFLFVFFYSLISNP